MSGGKSEDSNVLSNVAQPTRRGGGGGRKGGAVSMVSSTASMLDRMAEIDRYVAASGSDHSSNDGANQNNNNNNNNQSDWADPLQPVVVVAHSDSEVMQIDDSSISNQASLSGSNSNLASFEMTNQQQQPGAVEPWQLCPPVANNGHKCPQCSAGYSSKAALRRHIDSKHPSEANSRSQSSGGSSTGSSSKSAWQCEVCSRHFYHRSSLTRHYGEAHPDFVPIQPGPFGGLIPPVHLFPNPNDAIAAAAAAIQLGIFPPTTTFPSNILPLFPPPPPLPIAQTITTFSNNLKATADTPIVLSDEGSGSSPPRKKTDDNPQTDVECLFCGKSFANRNPALIFHQIVAHKMAAEQFNSELTPPNYVNCPDCSLPLNVALANFPSHTCPGPSKRRLVGVASTLMLCDKCGEWAHNEDAYAAHREREHNLFDCFKCGVVVESQDLLTKHECPKPITQIITTNNDISSNLFSCPLCSDRFTENNVLSEHVSGYHRTDFALFDKNGPLYGIKPSSNSIPTTNQSSPNNGNSSPENSIPPVVVVKEGEPIPPVETVEQPMISPTKRRPLANRASAADKWRNVDGFNCAHCGATFLTSQSRAQHVRWRHPEIFAAMSSPDRQQAAPEPNTSGETVESTTPPTPVASPTRTKSSETFVCPVCGSSYISARSRAQHIRWSHPDIQLTDPTILTLPNDNKQQPPQQQQLEDGNGVQKRTQPSSAPLDPNDEASLLASLRSGYKGSCEICGVALANAQGRSQHLRYKHPDAWALLRKESIAVSSSGSNISNVNGNNGESPNISRTDANGVRISPSDLVLSGVSPESGGVGENGGHFPCIFCEKVFASKRGRGRHYYWTHQHRNKDYEGPFPSDDYGRQSLLAAASRSPNGQSPATATLPTSDSTKWYACTRCPKRFLRRVGLSIHVAQAHRRSSTSGVPQEQEGEEKPVSSEPPNDETPTKATQPTTKKTSSPAANARCLECESCFASQGEVVRHLLEIHNVSEPTDANWVWTVVHGDDEEDADLMDGDFIRETTPASAETNRTCPTCQKTFPNELLFKGHMLLEHEVGGVISSPPPGSPVNQISASSSSENVAVAKCSDCGKAFTSTRALHIHEHHTQHGPHRSTSKNSSETTSQPGKIRCLNCNDHLLVFATQSELQAHQQQKHKPFRCLKCHLLIEGSEAYRVHRCEVGGGRKRPYEVFDLENADVAVICGNCHRSFVSTRALHIHQRMSSCQNLQQPPVVISISPTDSSGGDSVAEVFPCDMCSETFTRPQGLACHKRSKHNYVSMSPRSVASRNNKINIVNFVPKPTVQTTVPDPTLLKFGCRKCHVSFDSRYDLIEHGNLTNSKCGSEKLVRCRSYQSRVWGAIRQALLARTSINKKRRESVERWLKNGPTPPPPPPPKEPSPKNKRPRRTSTTKKAPSPPRPPGKRSSPQTKPNKNSSKKAALSPVKSTGKQQGEQPQPQQATQAASGMNRCSMCSREFPTPVQLMIHYCRDNCAGKSQQKNEPEPLRPSLPDVPLTLPVPPTSTTTNVTSSVSTAGAECSSSTSSTTAGAPRKVARMKRPTTFDSSEDGGDRPSPAFL